MPEDSINITEKLMALIRLTCLVSSSLDPVEIRKRSIKAATRLLGAETGSLLMLDEEAGELYFEVALGEKGTNLKTLRLKKDQGIAGWVAHKLEPVIVDDAQNDPRFFKGADDKSGFVTRNLICVPVKTGKKVIGALQVINKLDGSFDDMDAEILQAFSNQVAIAIENANLYSELRETYYNTVEGLATIIEKRDPYTGGHTKRVREYSDIIGQQMGLVGKELEDLRLSAILHDIGKIGVPDSVLHKRGLLNQEEFRQMSEHSAMGADMLGRIKQFRDLVPNIRAHHEKLDSSGYPAHLSGEEIPLISRIIAVADAFDAMTSDRPYREGREHEEALEELRRCSGRQFDPRVVEAFCEAWKNLDA